ncbi:MAG: glycosyltransferase [Chloroflexi bacterium]|nr:glycosyltransferase [Chloroflexota bacterium]
MRICLIGPTYPYRGGIAHYTTLLCRALRAEGHQVDLVSFRRQYPAWLFPGQSERDPSQTPLREPAMYALDSINLLTWLATAIWLRQRQPKLLILQWWVPFWAPMLTVVGHLVRWRSGIRIVFICHNILPHDRGSRWNGILARWTLRCGHHFVVQSRQERDVLHSLLPNRNIQVTGHPSYSALLSGDIVATHPERELDALPTAKVQSTGGLGQVEPEQNRPLRSMGQSSLAAGGVTAMRKEQARAALGLVGGPLLLFCGFVRPYKGLDILLQAMQHIDLTIHLCIAGEGWRNAPDYAAQIAKLNLSSRVTWINRYLPDEELKIYLDAADVAVLPYRSATQSGVVQLAFGGGLPVISTQVGGLAEAVEHGVTGLLVPPEDPLALAQAITSYYADNLEPIFRYNLAQRQTHNDWRALAKLLAGMV